MALRSVLRRIHRNAGRNRPVAAVLMYHRVARIGSDPFRLAVTPDRFRQHLRVLQAHSVVPLSSLPGRLREPQLGRPSVVLTFDDGYQDVVENVLPLLEARALPATVFVVTGAMRERSEFWWDSLERLVLGPENLPTSCRIRIGRASFEWRSEIGDGEDRLDLLDSLWKAIQPLTLPDQRTALEALAAWSGADSAPRSTHVPLDEDQVRALDRSSLVEVGAHSVTHPRLPVHDPAVQREEMQGSKKQLEALLGRDVTSFAYPYGASSPTTTQLAREAGFRVACSATPGLVDGKSDPFHVPRFEVKDWDGEVFARQLESWLSGRGPRGQPEDGGI